MDGHHYQVPDDQVFLMIPGRVFREYRENGGGFRFNNDEFEEVGIEDRLIHFRSSREGYEIWVNNDSELPIIVKMKNNPVGIDWEIKR